MSFSILNFLFFICLHVIVNVHAIERPTLKYNLVIFNNTLNLYCSSRHLLSHSINVWKFKYGNDTEYRPICTIEENESECYYKEKDSLFDGAKISRGHFYISRMTPRHSGQYLCNFKDIFESEDIIFEVTVYPNQLVKYMEPLFVNETLILLCPVEDYRNAALRMWLFKSPKSYHYKLISLKNPYYCTSKKSETLDPQFATADVTTKKLQIDQVTPLHGGIYQCRHENESMAVIYLFHVTIIASQRFQYIDTIHAYETLNLHCPLEKMDNSAKKQWLFKAPNTNDYIIVCLKRPGEKKCITQLNGYVIYGFYGTEISSENVKIERVSSRQSGIYKCLQENKTISMNYTFEVNVNENRRIEYIYSSAHNGSITLRCPLDFRYGIITMWLFKSNKLSGYKPLCLKLINERECIKSTNLDKMFANAKMTPWKLQIDRQHKNQGGTYQCRLLDDYGTHTHNFYVNVEEKQQFNLTFAYENDSLTLHCPLDIFGNSGIRLWQFKKDEISNSRVMCMKKANENKCIRSITHDPLFDTTKMTSEKVQIERLKPLHGGLYQCLYVKESTTLKHTFQVIVSAKPISIYMGSVYINEALTILPPIELIDISATIMWNFKDKLQCYKPYYNSGCDTNRTKDPLLTSEEVTPERVQIKRVQEFHSGTYQFVYKNESNELFYNFNVNVRKRPDIKSDYHYETSIYDIVCPIEKNSNSAIKMWLFKPYKSSKYILLCMKKSNQRNCSKSNTLQPLFSSAEMSTDKFKIKSLLPQHGGFYQCQYMNESTLLQYTFHLRVIVKEQLEFETFLEYEHMNILVRQDSFDQFGRNRWSFMSNTSRNFVCLYNNTQYDHRCKRPELFTYAYIKPWELYVDQLTTLHSGKYQSTYENETNQIEKTVIVNVIANERIDNMYSKVINETVNLHCPIEKFDYSENNLWLIKYTQFIGYMFVCMEKPDESECIESNTLDAIVRNHETSLQNGQIERVTNVHGGIYQCQYAAKNILTKYSFGLTQIANQPMKFMVPVRLNGNLTLRCPIQKFDNSARMVWLFKSNKTSDYRFMCMKMADETECKMSTTLDPLFATAQMYPEKVHIDRVTALHDGEYQCQYTKESTVVKYTFHVTVIDDRTCDFCSNWPKIISFKLFCKKPLRMKVKVAAKSRDDDWTFYNLVIEQIWPEQNRQILFQDVQETVQVRMSNKFAECNCVQLKVSQFYLIMDTNFFFGQFSKSDGTIITQKSFVENWNEEWNTELDNYFSREITGNCNEYINPFLAVVYPIDMHFLKAENIVYTMKIKKYT